MLLAEISKYNVEARETRGVANVVPIQEAQYNKDLLIPVFLCSYENDWLAQAMSIKSSHRRKRLRMHLFQQSRDLIAFTISMNVFNVYRAELSVTKSV